MKEQIIIIGAGPAGLTAAYEIAKDGRYIPVVLEASNSVGGISKTIDFDGYKMDLGGHRFFTKSKEINALWQEILPFGDPNVSDNVMMKRTRVSRIFFLNKFFDYPLKINLKTILNLGLFKTIYAGFGYLKACIIKKPEDNLENFYINRFGKPLYNMFFRDYTKKVWGKSPSEIEASWGAQRVKGLSLFKAVFQALNPFKKNVETSLIDEFLYPKYGPGQMFNMLADKVRSLGGIIKLGEEVTSISFDEAKNIKSIKTNKNEYSGINYLSTMPIKDLFVSFNNIDIPKEVYACATTLPYRDFMTVGLVIDDILLKNKKTSTYVSDNWIYVQDNSVLLGRIQIFNNWSPYMVRKSSNNIFLGLEYFCLEGDKYWNMTDSDFIDLAIEELIKLKIIKSKTNVLSGIRVKVKKAYPAYFDSYKDFDSVKEYLNTIDNLYCIGRNGQHRYNNMDHSMLSAIYAVSDILENKKDKEKIWNVNTEKEYHETK